MRERVPDHPQPSWLTGVSLAWAWFLGDNDSATPMFDPQTGGGYDGLERDGRNCLTSTACQEARAATAQLKRLWRVVADGDAISSRALSAAVASARRPPAKVGRCLGA
jgi:hypothetical protein